MYKISDARNGRTHIYKIKSHLDKVGPAAVQKQLIRFDRLVGNTLADEVAEATALRIQPDMNAHSKASWCEQIGFSVAKRLAIIQADVWGCDANAGDIYELDFLEDLKPIKQSITNASTMCSLVGAGHRLQRTSRGFQCQGCRITRAIKNFSYWENNVCRPRPPACLVVQRRRQEKAQALHHHHGGNDAPATKCARFELAPRHDPAQTPANTPEQQPAQRQTPAQSPDATQALALTPASHAQDPQANPCTCACAQSPAPTQAPAPAQTPAPGRAPATTKIGNSLDDPDGPDFQEEEASQSGLDDDPWLDEAHHADAPTDDPVGLVYRRRIRGKTRPADTSYAHIRPRGTRLEQATRKRKIQETRSNNAKQQKASKVIARQTMTRNVGIISNLSDKKGFGDDVDYDWSFANAIHSSHNLQEVKSHGDAVFCSHCGYYNTGGPLRALRDPCPGKVPAERQSLHKMLLHGQIPKGVQQGIG